MSRQRHYVFAHRVVPAVFLADPVEFIETLKTHGRALVRGLWLRSGSWWTRAWAGRAPLAEVHTLGPGATVVLLTMPPPCIETEAYFVALACRAESRFPAIARVYTLEHSFDFASKGPRTVLGGWTRSGGGDQLSHLNCGTGPDPRPEAFLEWIQARFPEDAEAEAHVPVVCSQCGTSTTLEHPDGTARDALHKGSVLHRLREEISLLRRTKALFDQFPDSKDPMRLLRLSLDQQEEGTPDPRFRAALEADPELRAFLDRSLFKLPGRLEFVEDRLDEFSKLHHEAYLACDSCGSGVLRRQSDVGFA